MATRLPFPLLIPFVEQLGLELHRCDGGHAEVQVDLETAHLNAWEVAHGGVLMTMLDVAMAHAARSLHDHGTGPGPGVATVEMKTTFMRPALGRLKAQARVLHHTSTLAFCEASVFDEDHHLCAHGTATFKVLRRLPARGPQGRALKSQRRNDEEATP